MVGWSRPVSDRLMREQRRGVQTRSQRRGLIILISCRVSFFVAHWLFSETPAVILYRWKVLFERYFCRWKLLLCTARSSFLWHIHFLPLFCTARSSFFVAAEYLFWGRINFTENRGNGVLEDPCTVLSIRIKYFQSHAFSKERSCIFMVCSQIIQHMFCVHECVQMKSQFFQQQYSNSFNTSCFYNHVITACFNSIFAVTSVCDSHQNTKVTMCTLIAVYTKCFFVACFPGAWQYVSFCRWVLICQHNVFSSLRWYSLLRRPRESSKCNLVTEKENIFDVLCVVSWTGF